MTGQQENKEAARLEISSCDGLRFDPKKPKYVIISQEDSNDEYYTQELSITAEDAPKIIEFLKKEFSIS